MPVCPFGAKLCVLGHCLLCKIVTPSCFCCSQLRAGLRLFGFLISLRVLFHHAAVWCVGVPVDSLSLLIFVCIRFFSPFLQGFCVRRHVVRSVSALLRCSSCAIAVLPFIASASACLDTLQTVFAAVHGAYCPTVALFLTFSLSLGTSCHNKTCSKKKKKKKSSLDFRSSASHTPQWRSSGVKTTDRTPVPQANAGRHQR